VAINVFGGTQDAVYWLAIPYGFGVVFLITGLVCWSGQKERSGGLKQGSGQVIVFLDLLA
jgi:hypothetical protein